MELAFAATAQRAAQVQRLGVGSHPRLITHWLLASEKTRLFLASEETRRVPMQAHEERPITVSSRRGSVPNFLQGGDQQSRVYTQERGAEQARQPPLRYRNWTYYRP